MRTGLGLALAMVVVAPACAPGDEQAAPTTTTERRPRLAAADAPRLAEGRRELAGALWQGHVAVVGGIDERGRPSARLDLYDPEARRWSRGPDLPTAVFHAAAVVLGDRLWLIGGETATGPTAEVRSLGPAETSWRAEAPLTTPRAAVGAAVAGAQIVAVAGRGPAGLLATTELYDPASRSWRPAPTLTGVARDHVAVVAVGSLVYALSGQRGRVGDSMAIVETLALPDGAWQELPPGLDIDRGGATAFTLDDRPCAAGGEPEAQLDAFVECLLDDGWTTMAHIANQRHGLAAVVAGRDLHLIGGGTQSGRYVINDHDVVTLPAPLRPPF